MASLVVGITTQNSLAPAARSVGYRAPQDGIVTRYASPIVQREGRLAQKGTGVPCREAQCDGVPCLDLHADCADCDKARPGTDRPSTTRTERRDA